MKYKFYCLFILQLFLVTACSRSNKSETSSVVVQMPSLSAASKLASKSTDTNTILSDATSSRPVPTGFSGTQPINCYVLMVGGPEAMMSRNTCKTVDGSSLGVGPWVGGVPSGGNVNIDVSAGKSRVFYLIGFYSTAGACTDFKSGGMPGDSLISKPYILGKTGGVTLAAGETKALGINIAYDSTQTIQDCSGPDFSGSIGGGSGSGGGSGGGSTTTVATKYSVEHDEFPYNLTLDGTCSFFDLNFRDDNGRFAPLAAALNVTLVATFNASGTQAKFYSSRSDCLSDINNISTLVVPQGKGSTTVYYKTIYGNNTDLSGLNISITTDALTPIGINAPNYQLTRYYYSSVHAVRLVGPGYIMPDMCYPYLVNQVQLDGSYMTPISVKITSDSSIDVFKDSACANSSAGNSTANSGTLTGASNGDYVYLKFKSSSGAISGVVRFGPSDDASVAQKVIYAGYGSTTPTRLAIYGDNSISIGANSYYTKPYMIYLVNEYGIPVLNQTGSDLTISTADSIGLNSLGTSIPSGGGSSVSINSGYSGVISYLYTSTATYSQTLSVRTTYNGSILNGLLNISVYY